MRSGRLRMFVAIERSEEVRTSSGAFTTEWRPFAQNVPAEILSINGREFFQAAQEQREIDTKITIRRLAGVNALMRVIHDGTIYNVKTVLQDPTQRSTMMLMCRSGTNQG